jgi:hypothetical protein
MCRDCTSLYGLRASAWEGGRSGAAAMVAAVASNLAFISQ